MNITISLTAEEQAAFLQLLDAAVKHIGLGAVDAAVHFKAKLAAAQSGNDNGRTAPVEPRAA
jgi:predicted AAA+ superfamily ATPase